MLNNFHFQSSFPLRMGHIIRRLVFALKKFCETTREVGLRTILS